MYGPRDSSEHGQAISLSYPLILGSEKTKCGESIIKDFLSLCYIKVHTWCQKGCIYLKWKLICSFQDVQISRIDQRAFLLTIQVGRRDGRLETSISGSSGKITFHTVPDDRGNSVIILSFLRRISAFFRDLLSGLLQYHNYGVMDEELAVRKES